MSRKETRSWTWTRTDSPQQRALVLLSVFINSIMSFNINVSVVINDYHRLRGGGGGAFIKKPSDGHFSPPCLGVFFLFVFFPCSRSAGNGTKIALGCVI